MKAKTKKPAKPRVKAKPPVVEREKLEQTWIPGTEPETIPEVEEAAVDFYDCRQEKRELNAEFHDKTIKLIDRMRAHDLTQYQMASGHILKIDQNAAVKCKKKKKPKKGELGGEE